MPFFTKSGLGCKWLIFLFVLKIGAGLTYAWFYSLPAYENSSDTWRFFYSSREETQWLLHDPAGFLKDLFTYGYNQSGNLFKAENSYWNDLKNNILVKLMAVFNVFTGTNYYADLIFFNFLYFFGPVALYRLMQSTYKRQKIVLILPVFLVPSFLFWCSGVHKDGLIFTVLVLTVYSYNVMLQQKKPGLKYVAILLISILVLFALRNFLTILLIPALFAWWLSNKFQSYKWLIFTGIYALLIILFFSSSHFSASIDLPQYIITKQSEFKQLPGNSQVKLPVLTQGLTGFVNFLPYALDVAFLQPHITEAKNFSYVPAAIENICVLLFILICLFLKQKHIEIKPLIIFCLFFSVSFLLLIGYTVTYSGSIVRYKSIILPFFLIPFCIMIDFNRMAFWERKKIL